MPEHTGGPYVEPETSEFGNIEDVFMPLEDFRDSENGSQSDDKMSHIVRTDAHPFLNGMQSTSS